MTELNFLNEMTPNELKKMVKCWVTEELKNQQKAANTEKPDKFLTVSEAAEFLGFVPITIYTKVAKGELQAFKRGKRLYFSRNALIEYIKAGQKPVYVKKERG